MPFEREFKYFLEHQEELVRQHEGKHLVIVGEDVVGVYDTVGEAYRGALETHEPGTFMIQKAEPGEKAYTHVFRSRVRVA